MRKIARCNGVEQEVEAPALDHDIVAPEKKDKINENTAKVIISNMTTSLKQVNSKLIIERNLTARSEQLPLFSKNAIYCISNIKIL